MGKPNMEIRIVPLERRHISILAELEQVCFADPWSENALIEELENPQAVFLTAENLRGEVLGYAGMHNILGEGYIDNIAVFPQMQGKGIGSELVNALLNYGEQNGLIFITLEVRPSNEAALSLYRKYGFQQEGVRRGYYRHPTEDAWILTRWFPPAGHESLRKE